MPGETVESNKNDMKNDTIIEVSQNSIEEIFVDSIEGRTCYFSLAGDLAIKAFEILKYSTFDEKKKKAKTKVAFMQRLDFAVLMFDHVVIHCSDPLIFSLRLTRTIRRVCICWVRYCLTKERQ